jgi:hypothetical protein
MCSSSHVLMRAAFVIFISPMHATQSADNCYDINRCPQNKSVQYIRILYPVSGSQLQMSECRVRYVVENAPSGASSCIYIGKDKLVFYGIDEQHSQIFDPYVDETILLYPGIWMLKVSFLCLNARGVYSPLNLPNISQRSYWKTMISQFWTCPLSPSRLSCPRTSRL